MKIGVQTSCKGGVMEREINNGDQDFLQELLSLRRSSQTSSSWDSTTSTATFSTQMIHSNADLNSNVINTNNNVWRTTPSTLSDINTNNNNSNTSTFPIMSSSSSSWDPSLDHQISFTTNHLSSTFNQVFHTPTTTSTFASNQHHQPHPHFVTPAPHIMEDETASFLVQQDDFFPDPFPGFEDNQHQVLNTSLMDEEQAMLMMLLNNDNNQSPKMEQAVIIGTSDQMNPSMFNMGCLGSDFLDRKSGKLASKKVQGQPSKNLMAERRRRKRLNDRLSMLRSIVPKISKMDRTSIVGDTIDYMKELLERIQRLQEELGVESSDDQVQLLDLFKDHKSNNDVQIRNTPKFQVERRNMKDTRVEIRCSGKPGLLLSTLSTMEDLGLEIEQCVISCFNEFEMNASCSEGTVRTNKKTDCEQIKEAMFRNAGYGGRCL